MYILILLVKYFETLLAALDRNNDGVVNFEEFLIAVRVILLPENITCLNRGNQTLEGRH